MNSTPIKVIKVIAFEVNGQLIPQKDVAEREVRKLVLQELIASEMKHGRDMAELPEVLAHRWNEINRKVTEAFAGT